MRKFEGKLLIVIGIWGTISAIFHIYTAFYGAFEPRLQRAIHVFLLLPLVFLVYPRKQAEKNSPPSALDWILAVLAFMPSLYLIVNSEKLVRRLELVEKLTTIQFILGVLVVILVLEACRRAVSKVFAALILAAIVYFVAAPYITGGSARSYNISQIVEMFFMSTSHGVYGYLTGIGSNILMIFIIFAAVMVHSGVGQFFMDVAVRVAGRFRGGPAKVSVISSGLYASVSGSSLADLYSTGGFTIPMMKKMGYKPHKAGAIEAVASAGGPLMPPVMGAGAFIMAEMTSTPYVVVIQAAVLAAILYYIGILASVHFESVAEDIKQVPKDWYKSWKSILKRLPLIIPFIALIYFLVDGYSPAKAAVYSIFGMLIMWILTERRKFKISNLFKAFEYAAKSGTVIVSAITGASLLVTVVSQTGLGLSLGQMIVKSSFGIVWVALFLVMITVLILGAGIPATPAYILTAAIATGSITSFGIPILTAHLFVFYFAILAEITPPIGTTAFAAGSLANASPMKTVMASPSFAFSGFIVPFIFVAKPELLLGIDTNWTQSIVTFILTAIAVIGISSSIFGALFVKIGWVKRMILVVVSIFIIVGPIYVNLISLLLLGLFVGIEYFQSRSTLKAHKDTALNEVQSVSEN